MCVQLLSEIYLFLRRIDRDMIKNVHWSPCKVPVIPVRFEWNLNFLDSFAKSTYISDFNENSSSGMQFVVFAQTEGRTDMTKLIVAFRNFAIAPKTLNIFIFSTT